MCAASGNRDGQHASQALSGCGLIRDVPLWKHTSLRVGGPAHSFAQPADAAALLSMLQWAKRTRRPCVILGAGTNIVFSDTGFDGLVVATTKLRGRSTDGVRIQVAAGERLTEIAWMATRSGLSGLEWACGIPGTIGGAVVMNTGAAGSEIGDVLESTDLVVEDAVETVPATALRLGYRTSALRTGELTGTAVAATFVLQQDAAEICIERARRMLAERLQRLPIGASAGSIFRNPANGPTAGELLDRAGCKGLRIGRAVVSPQHANVIVNEATRNAGEILSLIDVMKRRAFDRFGIELEEEIVRLDQTSTERL